MDMVAITLHATHASGSLTPAVLGGALARMQKARPSDPRGLMRGQVLRLARALPLEDPACVELQLDVAAQGARVRGTARGPRRDLLVWAFHALARELRCRLVVEDEGDIEVDPARVLDAANAYLESAEADVRAERERGTVREGPAEAKAFVAWLAAEGEVEPAGDPEVARLAETLPMDDHEALYEALLESDAIEDVFASESEMKSLLARFRARAQRP